MKVKCYDEIESQGLGVFRAEIGELDSDFAHTSVSSIHIFEFCLLLPQ